RSTFFQCGIHARRLPGLVQSVAAAGHEVGNHTDTHAALWLRSPAFISGELERAQRALPDAGAARLKLFRAPYGVRWPGLRAAQERLGLMGVMWTLIGRDWTLSGRD